MMVSSSFNTKRLIIFTVLSCLFVVNADSIINGAQDTESSQTNSVEATKRSRTARRSSGETTIRNNNIDNLEQQEDEIFLRRHADISASNEMIERDLQQCTGQNSCPNRGDECWCFFTILMWEDLPCNYQQALMRMNETEESWDNCLVNEIWGYGWYDLSPDHRAAVRTLGFDEDRWYDTGYYSCDWDCGTGNPTDAGRRVNNCLSGQDELQVLDKGLTSVNKISEGDKVLVSDNEYQEIYSFGHKDAYAVGNFLQFTTSLVSQKKPLELSEEHLVLRQKSPHSDGGGAVVPVRADNIQVGDFLIGSHGGVGGNMVTHISTVRRPGLYSPLTNDGLFFANGFLVSSYTAAQEKHRESFLLANLEVASHHFMSHVAMTPFRSVCRVASYQYVCEQRNDRGQLLFVAFAENNDPWISVVLFLNIIPLYFIEQMLGGSIIMYLFPFLCVLISGFLYTSRAKKEEEFK